MTERNNGDVKSFDAIGGHEILTKIPSGIEMYFANLEAIHWTSGDISSIDSSTFKPFPDLILISLNLNKLVTLNGDLFQHTRKLQQFHVYKNLLKHVEDNLLAGLTDLSAVQFQLNPCIDVYAGTPQQIQELELQLPIQCPPEIECPSTCMINDVMERIAELERPDPCTSNEETNEIRKRMEEIEKVVSELSSSPCSCHSA